MATVQQQRGKRCLEAVENTTGIDQKQHTTGCKRHRAAACSPRAQLRAQQHAASSAATAATTAAAQCALLHERPAQFTSNQQQKGSHQQQCAGAACAQQQVRSIWTAPSSLCAQRRIRLLTTTSVPSTYSCFTGSLTRPIM
jgi:hypothetical protein